MLQLSFALALLQLCFSFRFVLVLLQLCFGVCQQASVTRLQSPGFSVRRRRRRSCASRLQSPGFSDASFPALPACACWSKQSHVLYVLLQPVLLQPWRQPTYSLIRPIFGRDPLECLQYEFLKSPWKGPFRGLQYEFLKSPFRISYILRLPLPSL